MNKHKLICLFSLFALNFNASTYYFIINEKTNKQYEIDSSKEWTSSTSLFTDWEDINLPYNYSLFLPEITLQEENFTQTQTYDQEQKQIEQPRIYEEKLDIYKDNGDTIDHFRVNKKNTNRTIYVSLGSWTNVGSHYNCGIYTPLENTINKGISFTQTRTCQQEQNLNITYSIENNNIIDNKNKTQTINEIETKESTGTKGGIWVVTGNNQRHPAYGWLSTYSHEPIEEVSYRVQSSIAGDYCEVVGLTKLFGNANCYSQLIDMGGHYFDGMTCVGEVTTCQ